MHPRVSVITLAVQDLPRAVAFYRDGLGWPTDGIIGKEIENGAVAFFHLQDRLILALFPQASLAADSKLSPGANNPTSFSLGHNVGTKEEVDAAIDTVVRAGARVVEPPAPRAWGGYSGYFQDPDGHLWEVVWNPQLDLETGRIKA